ncbi:ATP dependent RNA helicase [Grosmannia clavigera kw1407]|uniref:RNA helicase n=1 Tax=Grosmannia clavigera (strain kw1407 / UAMH 11150) TaxID=655863 RepID=F0XAA1_GROCL|nr:ATP dependent RNA helicase [Grosmannia clavigera kw1407]EFX05523.1 ATP dependent RNA helicase [Grosmannia clavigera kw1407]
MLKRQYSPTPSENEVDILGPLFAEELDGFAGFDVDENSNDGRQQKRVKAMAMQPEDLDLGAILDGRGGGAGTYGQGDSEEDDEAYIALQQAAAFRKSSNLKGNTVKKGGGFQALGLNANLLRAITRKGFSVPTPIQRKTIPLIMGRRDVVGMARTGSGKTAAFVIPMIERLRAHSARVGARALVLSPSRELALQTLKVVKELGKGTDLKTILLVGGDSLEEQFGLVASNPDIVIATPGRFLHLKVEMSLDLSSVRYVVFDEADRLFEMGFAAQLTEILHALPPSRQTLLFSATLPSTLVEFARAGLQDPSLVRLDAETKISPDLQSAFFSVKGSEKEGALLHLLHDVIGMPLGQPAGPAEAAEGQFADEGSKKRKRDASRVSFREKPTEHSTIVFAATKHHVEYVAAVLREAGFAVSYVYGSLDQTARKMHVDDFRRGRTNILVVTDLAARGIDIPVLANVINYDFPPQAKVFVHRVGRTARAGQRGWSYSLVQDTDAPYLVDLQLFLGRRLVVGREVAAGAAAPDMGQDVVVGSLARSAVEPHVEWVNTLLSDVTDVEVLRTVTVKAQRQYYRTRLSASSQSARRAREMVAGPGWGQLHVLFAADDADTAASGTTGETRAEMLAKITGYKPVESIFEVSMQGGKKATKSEAAVIMRTMRKKLGPRKTAAKAEEGDEGDEEDEVDVADKTAGMDLSKFDSDAEEDVGEVDMDSDLDSDTEQVTVADDATHSGGPTWLDKSVYMTYTPRTGGSISRRAAEERGYGVHATGADEAGSLSFAAAARDATMDLTNDETAKAFGVPTRSKMRWDKKQHKYVSRTNDEDGSRAMASGRSGADGAGGGKRMIRGESGVKIAASFRSGRFDKWRRANRLGSLPRVGENERAGLSRQVGVADSFGGGVGLGSRGGHFWHKKELAPKEADRFRDDFHVRKKRVAEARENRVGRFRDGDGSRGEEQM